MKFKISFNYIFSLIFLGLFVYYSYENAPISEIIIAGVFYITSCIRVARDEIIGAINNLTTDEE